jgi:peroxiredoxin
VIGDHLAMIVAVDNECGMCRIAADQMRYVCEQIAQAGVQYFFVSFTSPGPPSRFFEYIDSLKIDSPAFLWMKDEGQPPVTLSRMIVPSHILIDHTGVVKQVWLGGNDAKPIRDRMANQIVNDTLKALASGS